MGRINVSNIPATCNNQYLSVSFAVDTQTVTTSGGVTKPAISDYGAQFYSPGQNIVCTQKITGITKANEPGSLSFIAGQTVKGVVDNGSGDICQSQQVTNGTLLLVGPKYNLNKVVMNDIASNIGIQIANTP